MDQQVSIFSGKGHARTLCGSKRSRPLDTMHVLIPRECSWAAEIVTQTCLGFVGKWS